MTKEEKAKAYDEALERAKDTLQKSSAKDVAETVVYHFFPELAENDDEKIRKSIIHILHVGGYMSPEEKDKVFAYLEKQKDTSKAIKAVEKIDKYINDHRLPFINAHDIKNSTPDKYYYIGWDDALNKISELLQDIYPIEKKKDKFIDETMAMKDEIDDGFTKFMQKEQKPVEWSDNFEENIRVLLHDKLTWHSEDGSASSTVLIDNKTLKDIISGIWFYVEKELKPAEWSEEDEKQIRQIERIIKDAGCTVMFQRHIHNWFKSLRPQPKQELSKEDEIRLKEALEVLNETLKYLPVGDGFYQDVKLVQDWLESRFKPLCPHLKPTEEQMRVLSKATPVNLMPEELSVYISLYEELKKLI